MNRYDDLIDTEIIIMTEMNNFFNKYQYFQNLLSKLISKNPWNDICIIIWLIFLFGLIEYRLQYFWIVSINICISYTLNQAIKSKRPIDYDRKFQPKTDVIASSYGFPSLESYLCIVIFGYLYIKSNSFILLFLSLFITLFIGFTRVYSNSRFIHQIIGSWILGIIGLTIVYSQVNKINLNKLSQEFHIGSLGLIFSIFICNLALSIESNDSRLFGINKSEFITVMADIMNGSQLDSIDNNTYNNQSNNNTYLYTTPRTKLLNEKYKRDKDGYIPKDSFYYLQELLVKRDIEIKELKSKLN